MMVALPQSWTGQTFDPPVALDIATLEGAILAQLKNAAAQEGNVLAKMRLEHFPDRPDAFRLANAMGAVLVRYHGTTYGPNLDTFAVVQDAAIHGRADNQLAYHGDSAIHKRVHPVVDSAGRAGAGRQRLVQPGGQPGQSDRQRPIGIRDRRDAAAARGADHVQRLRRYLAALEPDRIIGVGIAVDVRIGALTTRAPGK